MLMQDRVQAGRHSCATCPDSKVGPAFERRWHPGAAVIGAMRVCPGRLASCWGFPVITWDTAAVAAGRGPEARPSQQARPRLELAGQLATAEGHGQQGKRPPPLKTTVANGQASS